MTSTASSKNLSRWNFVASLAVVLLAACVSPAFAQEQPAPASPDAPVTPPIPSLFEKWKITLDVGARDYDLYGDHPGRFLENRDVTRGFYANGVGLRFESADSPYLFWFNASDIRQLDETIQADVWKVGKFRTTFLWDRLPRFYSDGTSLFQSPTPGTLLVSASIRSAIQAVVNGQLPQNISPALGPLIKGELAAVSPTDLRVKNDLAGLRQTVRLGRLELHFQAKTLFNRGTRPKGAGTFARQANGPQGDGTWESLGSELPEPVQYRTTDIKIGAIVSGVKWRFGFDYGLTLFRNNVGTLTYQNPFRISDAVAIDAAGNPSPGGAIGRNRFVTQQLSLPPDSDYHRVTAWWGVDLPRNTQFRGLFSWGQSSQNDPFLPYTQNTALVGTGLGFANNIPPGTSVLDTSSLPQRSLNGQVRNLNYDSTLVSKPWKNMNFRLQYRNEDMKNKSPSIVIPGFPRFGESHWVTAVDYYNVPIRNFPTSFVRQDAIGSWEWNITNWVTWTAEYQYEHWKRTFRDVPDSAENSIRGRLDFKLPRKMKFVADYTFSNRDNDLYKTVPMVFSQNLNANLAILPAVPFGPGYQVSAATQFDPTVPLEFSQLRRYDETARKRYDAKAALDVPFNDNISFSASYRFTRDNYAKGFYGLQHDLVASVDTELTYSIGERTFIYADYSRQFEGYRTLGLGALICGGVPGATPSCVSGAPANVSACCAIYPIQNTWDRSSRSSLDTAQVGINWASKGERIVTDLSYGYSYAKDRIHTFNPFPILVFSPRTAGTYNYPDTMNRFQEVLMSSTRKIRPGLDLGVQYRFEAYHLDDFFLNNLLPYSPGQFANGGVPTNLSRQLFLNARFGTSHAHEEGFFLRYSF